MVRLFTVPLQRPGLRSWDISEMLLQVKNLRCGYGSLEVVHGVSLQPEVRIVGEPLPAGGRT